MNDLKYEYAAVKKNIWQIEDDDGVCCTLVKGSELAVLIDTGYGKRNLRNFIEKSITTPYVVINSHGHPDHIGGNHLFDEVFALKDEWDVIRHFENGCSCDYSLKEISLGEIINLGDEEIEIISLSGHTKGSIGFLLSREKLLISGDAFNESLWLFNYGSSQMKDLYNTLKATYKLDFTSYLCGHSRELYPKEKLLAHIKNIENLRLENCSRDITIGFETYHSNYKCLNAASEIVFTEDKI